MMGEGKSEAQFMPTTVEVPKSEKELVEGAVDGLEKVVSVLREAIAQGKTEGVEAGLARIFGPEGMNALRAFVEGKSPTKTEETPVDEPMSEKVPSDVSARGQLNKLRDLLGLPQAK